MKDRPVKAASKNEGKDGAAGVLTALVRILEQEKKLSFQDRAVFGGLDKYLSSLAVRLDAAKSDPERRADILAIASPLQPYADLDTIAREREVERALAAIAGLASGPAPGVPPMLEGAMANPHPFAEFTLERSEGLRAGSSPLPSAEGRGNRTRSAGAYSQSLALPGGTGGPADAPVSPSGMRTSATKTKRNTVSSPNHRPSAGRAAPRPAAAFRGPLTLGASVRGLPGVGAGYGAKLERLGVSTIKDLLYLFPRRHLDYSVMKRIKDLSIGEIESVLGTIWEVKTARAKSGLPVITATVADETGTIQVMWFNQKHLGRVLTSGRQIVLSGRIEQNLGRPFLKSPDWELLEAEDLTHTGRLVPVYPLTEGLSQRWLRSLAKRALERWVTELSEHLPRSVRETAHLMDLHSAIAQAHFPDSQPLLERARERLIFDELFLIQLGMLLKKQRWQESQPGTPLMIDRDLLAAFEGSLPFELTAAQNRVLGEILADLQLARPMSRLLQGEVGSGKTVVATAAMLTAWANGCQSVLMAPTEILAEQHFRTVSRLIEDLGAEGQIGSRALPRVTLLKGAIKKTEKDEAYQAIASGEVEIVVGTHALIQEGVVFSRLGLAVVDEQHRFGVLQRASLRQKGYNPHMLVMTATPIPRTLALTLYGDLDISVIDELPPGRQEIKTLLLAPQHRQQAYDFVRSQVRSGRQCFVICPLIDESDKIGAKAATAEYERLRNRVFPDLKLGLLHGKMRPQEKDAAMEDFRQGKTDILVSTPVVEVGIDIPNATVMLIEGADRFGLAQLHQFRGRVGRGIEKSFCILLADSPSAEAEERLQVVTRTQDGFALAEADMRLRGPGEFFGTRQSGMPDLKMAKIGDVAAVERVRAVATALFARDPGLRLPEHSLLAREVAEFWQVDGELD